jgi:hypothetical protein
MATQDIHTFKPVASRGGVYTILFSVLFAGLLTIIFIPVIVISADLSFTIFGISFIAGISTLFVSLIHGYYTMAYQLSAKSLVLRWGFMKTNLLYDEITNIGLPRIPRFDGIRTGGVGIPDHLYGGFRLLLDGAYKPIKLVATKLSNLVIITMSNGKLHGITPEDPAGFIAGIKLRNLSIVEKRIDNESPLVIQAGLARSHALLGTIIFALVFIEVALNFCYVLAVHPSLPAIVPVHFDITGTPDRFGSKDELLWTTLFLSVIATAINMVMYIALRWKSELAKSRYGIAIMLLPLVLGTFFLVLNIATIAPLVP